MVCSMDSIFQKIKKILTSSILPTYDTFFQILNEASEVLDSERGRSFEYRPAASDGKCGSLLDFHEDELPVVVIPDFHARPYFLLNILEYPIFTDSDEGGAATVFEAVAQGRLRLLSVGDILHTERGTRERWGAAYVEFLKEIYTGPAISAEMQEGLCLLCALLVLKTNFPSYVHILKGNHENILNETGGGDFAFKKFVDEGEMCRCFIQEYYGDDILYLMNCVEKGLPLFYFGKQCSVSHAEPMRSFSRDELIDAKQDEDVVRGLIWTNNGEAEEKSARVTVQNLFDARVPKGYLYLGGHRPVQGNYKILQDGFYIQIHNPGKQNVVFVRPERCINLESDIIEVKR